MLAEAASFFGKAEFYSSGKTEKILQINCRNMKQQGTELCQMMHAAAFSKTLSPQQHLNHNRLGNGLTPPPKASPNSSRSHKTSPRPRQCVRQSRSGLNSPPSAGTSSHSRAQGSAKPELG